MVAVGAAVAIDMPMTAVSVMAYLGVVLAGCVVVSIADSFSPAEINTRCCTCRCLWQQRFLRLSGLRVCRIGKRQSQAGAVACMHMHGLAPKLLVRSCPQEAAAPE